MQITDLSEVLPTFYKQVDLDNSSWIREVSAKFSLLNGCIAYVVIELNVMHQIVANERKAKLVQKYETYNTKDMKEKNPKFIRNNHKE